MKNPFQVFNFTTLSAKKAEKDMENHNKLRKIFCQMDPNSFIVYYVVQKAEHHTTWHSVCIM